VTTSLYDPFDTKNTATWAYNTYQTVPYSDGGNNVVKNAGTWRELRRDLDADLRSVFGVGVERVLRIYIRGDYDLDDLTLIGREERSTYYAGGARVAMRVDDGGGDVVYYLHADHGR
jgi:hypothetical protein